MPGRLGRHALLAHPGDDQVGEADGGGAGAEKEDPLLLELAAGDLERVDQPGERHAAGALNVVIVAAELVAVAGKQGDRIGTGPILEVDAAIREDLLNRLHELVDEGIKLLGRRRDAAAGRDRADRGDRSRCWCRRRGTSAADLGRYAGRGGVELQLADRDAHAVGAQIAKAEIRPPSVTQMNRTSLTGQLRSTSFTCPCG